VVFVSVRGRMLEVHPDDILEREDDLQRVSRRRREMIALGNINIGDKPKPD